MREDKIELVLMKSVTLTFCLLIHFCCCSNAASQIGNLKICSQSQLTAWSKKAMAIYGTDLNTWDVAETASIGSVISEYFK